MTSCRSSRFLELTRISSPWIWALTPLGPSSRMSLVTFLAFSLLMPCLRVPLIRYVLPLGCGSPASNAFIEISRRISFSLNTSTAALARSSVEETISMVSSPFHSMVVSVPRKSNRVLSSLAAWFSALSTSWRSTLLTMSNDESATFGVLPRVIGRFVSSVHPRCTLLDASCRVFLARCFQAGCPSGQWERTVNPSANAYTGSNPVPATMVVLSS